MVDNEVKKKLWGFHPLPFALFPVLFVYSRNIAQLELSQVWASVAVVVGTTFFFFLCFALILRNVNLAAMVVSIIVLIFFAASPVTSSLLGLWPKISVIAGSRVALIAWGVVLLVATALAMRVRKALPDATRILNATSLALVSIPLLTIGYHEIRWNLFAPQDQSTSLTLAMTEAARDQLPNIYYVILDGYGRADVLDEIYGYDNSGFLSYLEEKGFYVADQSRTNYAQTALSMASALNMGYLNDQVGRFNPQSQDRGPLNKLIHGSAVVDFLRRHGYSIVAFPSGYTATDLVPADVYLGDRRPVNELEMTLLMNTPLRLIFYASGTPLAQYGPHRTRIENVFDRLAGTASLAEPRLVFAHVVAPHPPFVFDGDGNEVASNKDFTLWDGSYFMESGTPEEYLYGYTEQVTYVNKRMEAALDRLLSQPSSRPVVVILQADHGPGLLLDWDDAENTCMKERMSILNAYLLPGGGEPRPYATITPVNSFRLVLNRYFGTDLEMLEDRSYFSEWNRPYQFLDVTDQAASGEACPTK